MGRVDVSVQVVREADLRNTADYLERLGMQVDGVSTQSHQVMGSCNRRVISRLMACREVDKVVRHGQTYANNRRG